MPANIERRRHDSGLSGGVGATNESPLKLQRSPSGKRADQMMDVLKWEKEEELRG